MAFYPVVQIEYKKEGKILRKIFKKVSVDQALDLMYAFDPNAHVLGYTTRGQIQV